jgi:hypothetical protein
VERKLQEELLQLKSRPGGYDYRDEQSKWMERIQEQQQQCLDMKEIVRNAETTRLLL